MARANTKQLITEAAVRVASKQGISGASMDLISEEAGVAKGSLYYNFASKDALFAEVIREGYERLGAAIDAARAGVDPAEGPRAVAAATLETLRGNVDLAKLMAAEVFRTDRPWFEAMELAREAVTVRFRDVLRDAQRARAEGDRDLQDRGMPDRGADAITETAGAAFFGALAGACLDWLLFRPEQPVDRVLDQVLRAF